MNVLPNGAQTQYAIVSTPANWYKASQICSLNGYLLTSVISADLQAFISSSLTNAGIYSTDSFWIGGNDDAVEGRFYWEQGDPLTYSNWKMTAPNSGTQGNCILLLPQLHSYQWDDEDCNTAHKYICEKQIPGMSLENSQIISSLETAQTYVILNNQVILCRKASASNLLITKRFSFLTAGLSDGRGLLPIERNETDCFEHG